MTAPALAKDYLSPDAPTDHGPGRKCMKCRKPVSRYQGGMPGYPAVLLCYGCQKRCTDSGETPDWFVGRVSGRGPRGVPLPGLAAARKAGRISYSRLGEKANVNPSHLKKIEAGQNKAGRKVVRRIARALGVSEEELKGTA